MKCFFIFIVAIVPFFFNKLYAQPTLTGKVTDAKGEPLEGVSILLYQKLRPDIITTFISGPKGMFEGDLIAFKDSIDVEVSHIGYAKVLKRIASETKYYLFILAEADIVLPIITVNNIAAPIIKKGDTINFNVKKLLSPSDRVIGDLIKRLPGIKVEANGQIRYNGRPISNYYIENLDLLESRYNIANQNIPADLVDVVQVFENHQPVKILDSTYLPETAALNIKLNAKAKDRVMGTSLLGIGVTPFLWKGEILGFNFRKKFQTISGFKTNNTGEDLQYEINSLTNSVNLIGSTDRREKSVLSLAAIPQPPFGNKKSYFNESYLTYINCLMVLKNEAQLRVNASYLKSHTTGSAFSKFTYYLAQDTATFQEGNIQYSNDNKLRTEFSYTLNSKKKYLKNTLIGEANSKASDGAIIDTATMQQRIKLSIKNITNSFQLIFLQKKNKIEFNSNTILSNSPENLSVTPGSIYSFTTPAFAANFLQQHATISSFTSDNFFSFSKKIFKISSNIKTGVAYSNQQYITALQAYGPVVNTLPTDSFTNDLKWIQIKPYLQLSMAFTKHTIKVDLSSTLENIGLRQTDALLGVKNDGYFFLNSSLLLRKDLGPFFNISVSSNIENRLNEISANNTGYILSGYRNISRNGLLIQQEKSYSNNIFLTYRNTVLGLFGFITSTYSITEKNFISNVIFNKQLESTLFLPKFNKENTFVFSPGLNKYFKSIKSGLSLDATISYSKYPQFQSTSLVYVTSTISAANFSIQTRKLNWLFPEYSIGINSILFDVGNTGLVMPISKAILQINQTMKLDFFITKKLSFKTESSIYYSKNGGSNNRRIFIDGAIELKEGQHKIELKGLNLTNVKEFNAFNSFQNYQVFTKYRLRPINILLSYTFRF